VNASLLPALDVENGEDGIDEDDDLGSFYGTLPALLVYRISPFNVANGNATSAHR
jgi:hypothetical protein